MSGWRLNPAFRSKLPTNNYRYLVGISHRPNHAKITSGQKTDKKPQAKKQRSE
jgi:hypothetical protein